jgi:hypothetical protein
VRIFQLLQAGGFLGKYPFTVKLRKPSSTSCTDWSFIVIATPTLAPVEVLALTWEEGTV